MYLSLKRFPEYVLLGRPPLRLDMAYLNHKNTPVGYRDRRVELVPPGQLYLMLCPRPFSESSSRSMLNAAATAGGRHPP